MTTWNKVLKLLQVVKYSYKNVPGNNQPVTIFKRIRPNGGGSVSVCSIATDAYRPHVRTEVYSDEGTPVIHIVKVLHLI